MQQAEVAVTTPVKNNLNKKNKIGDNSLLPQFLCEFREKKNQKKKNPEY